MRGANRSLIAEVKNGLAKIADPKKAPQMQAYMKSEMPYYGVQAPSQRKLFRSVFAANPLPSFNVWKATVLTLWREAEFREERYAAIELTGQRSYLEYQTLESLPIYQEMIVTGAWWDYVDSVAIHRLGEFLLQRYPRRIKPLLRAWSIDEDMWKRRASIISQVALKKETDLSLLYACITNNISDREFFIRKAIGWALRAYAWVDPKEVKRFVAKNEGRMSPLSKREALKNVF